ncbi:MAG: hypothetical protein IJW11_01990 [Clostridia bacterium]|nr:hypothetical protein [Clostridia bacterium]
MKKVFTLLLMLVMCLSMLTGCFGSEWHNSHQNGGEADAALTAAADFLYNVMKDKEGLENLNDFDVVKKLVVDGVTYEVTWTTDNDKVKIVESSKASYWTVDIPTTNDVAFSYKLTATIKAADGKTITKEFNRKVGVIGADNALVVTDPQEGVDYKLFIVQYTARKVLFLKGATQNNENKYILGGDAKDGAIFRVEKADGGVKIYTEIDGAKMYLSASITLIEDGKTSKYLGFSADNPSVFYYKQNVGAWFTMIDNAEFVIGTYSTYETASLSEGKFMTEEAVAKKEQFAVSFMTKASADTYVPPVFEKPDEPADGSTLTIKEAIDLGNTFAKNGYSVGKFVVTGTVKQIQNDVYGNVVITDGTNDLLVYGMYDPAGKRFDKMATKPKEGDVITVKGTIGMYDAPQMKNGTLTKINDTELGGGSAEDGLILNMLGTITRVERTDEKTVHKANGITYTNDRGESTTPNFDNDTSNAARAYKSSTITISADKAFRKIVFTLDDYSSGKYLKGFDGMTVAGATITRNDDTVTIVLAEAKTSFTTAALLAQVRIKEIAVYEEAGDVGGEQPGEGDESGMTLVTAPEAGVGYYLRLTQGTLNKTLYINGATANQAWYLASVEDPAQAVLVYLEAVDGVSGAFRMYFTKDNVKTYIRVYERDASSKSGSLELVTSAPEEYFTFNSELKTLMYTKGENSYILNTYNDFNTFCVSHISKAPINFVSGLYQKAESGEPVAPHEHAYVPTVVAPTCTEAGYTEHKCECGDSYKDTYTDALGHKDENGDKVCDGCGIDRELYSVVDAPVVGAPYFLGLVQQKLGYNLYFSGKTADKDYYLATEKSAVVADTRVFLEAVDGVEGAYRLYFETEAGGKIYIRVYERDAAGKKGSLELVSTVPAEYFTYDKDLKTLVHTAGENAYYIGTYNTLNTLSVSHVSFASTSFVASFYVKNVTAHHAYTVTEVVEPTCTEKGYSVYTCACGDTYKANFTDTIPHVDYNDDKFCDECGADVRIYDVLIGNPTVGTPYYIGIFQGNLEKVLYFNGSVGNKDYYLATVEIPLQAKTLYLEEVNELGRRIYFYDEDGTKTYIRIYERDAEGKKGSLELTAKIPVEYFLFDKDLNTLVYKAASGNAYYLGTYSNFNTLSVSHIDYATKEGSFVARLYTIGAKPHEHLYTAHQTVAPKCVEQGYDVHTCPCGYSYQDNYTAAIGHIDANGDKACDDCSAPMSASVDMKGQTTRTEYSTEQFEHSANGVTVIVNKAGSSSECYDNTGSYAARLYMKMTVAITGTALIDKIVIKMDNMNNGQYVVGFDDMSLDGYVLYRADDTLTIVFSEPALSFVSLPLGSQVRVNSVEVFYLDRAHEHVYTSQVVGASCADKGYTLHTCECGNVYKDAWVDTLPHVDENEDKVCDNACGVFIGTPVAPGAVAPVAGVAYKLVIHQGKLGKLLYVSGAKSSHYGATVASATGDANVYIEATTDGFYMYCIVKGVKTYINMVVSGKYVNIGFDAEASTVYTYDADLKSAVATVNNEKYVFGIEAGNTYETYGPILASADGYVLNFVASTVADSEAPANSITYDFSTYTAGTQFADETHTLDANTTMTITKCHLNTQLRIYSSSTNNGNAIFHSKKAVTEIGVNAGNEIDDLEVYVSNDGETWTLAGAITTTSKNYTDYSLSLGGSYNYFKLDVKGSKQIRVATLSLAFAQ